MIAALWIALCVSVLVACFASAAIILDLRRCEKYER